MKIFVSYASHDRDAAEAVAHSLRGRGHKVFFDRSDLPAGGSFEDRIEKAILGADALVFLVSRESIAPGRFTLTELAIAERRWPHAGGRVLPVMIESAGAVAINELPAYLRAVTVLEPSGNVAAETALAVSRLRQRGIRRWAWAGAALVVLTVIVAAVTLTPSAPDIDITTLEAKRLKRAYLDVPATVLLRYKISNPGNATAELRGIEPVSEPPGLLTLNQGYLDEPEGVGPEVLVAGEVESNAFWANVAADAPADLSYRLCVRETSTGRHCSPPTQLQLYGDFEPATAFELPRDIATSATAVVRDGNGFVLATRSPPRVLRIAANGRIAASTDLPAEPVALSNGPHGLYVGTQGPDLLIRLDDELAETARRVIDLPHGLVGTFDDPVSTRPVSIAQDAGGIAVITRGGAAGSGLAFVTADLAELAVPDYFADIEFDLRDMRLVGGTEGFWGTQTNTTPASLYQLLPTRMTTYSGHDYDIVSCATDVAVRTDSRMLLLPDCDGDITGVTAADGRVMEQNSGGRARGYAASAGAWSTMRLAAVDGFTVAAVETGPSGAQAQRETIVTVLDHPDSHPLPETYTARLVDFAATPDAKLAILENNAGRRDTVVTRY